jgi:cytidyltransferase-like protein
MSTPKTVVVSGAFDDLKSRGIRFLEEASKLGELTVMLWNDDLVRARTNASPKFPEAERCYFLQSIRFISHVKLVNWPHSNHDATPHIFVVEASQNNAGVKAFCAANQIELCEISEKQLQGFPEAPAAPQEISARKKVIVTGSFDWFHSGHVRFLEEVSAFGDLFVIVGHDANIRLLKGGGHQLLAQAERRYVVGSIKFVKQALISSGDGWLDADPEIKKIKPDIYAVNEDGDKGGKREYCQKLGIEYLVLKRTPAPGLPKRSSTDLRGF